MENVRVSVSEFLALVNQTLEYAYPIVEVEGEVSSFKLNQGKYVFFDLKDESGTVGCFMMAWQLRMPIEDGMKVVVSASPKVTQWGKFSLTVRSIQPSGEGSIKKSYELLRKKLQDEGLFSAERKRSLPTIPERIGVISSVQAAGYADFIKILDDRWGGIEVIVANVQVQGASAPEQIIRALRHLNELETPLDMIVLIRGGGSKEDLMAFNDEPLVREIATSRAPTVVGVGHEIDETLAEFAADVRAATPSNAAQLITPDKASLRASTWAIVRRMTARIEQLAANMQADVRSCTTRLYGVIEAKIDVLASRHKMLQRALEHYDPRDVLRRGYAIMKGVVREGQSIEIELEKKVVIAEVIHVKDK